MKAKLSQLQVLKLKMISNVYSLLLLAFEIRRSVVGGSVPSLSVGWWSVFGGPWVGSNGVGSQWLVVSGQYFFNAPLRETGWRFIFIIYFFFIWRLSKQKVKWKPKGQIDLQNFLYRVRLFYWICFHTWLILLLSMTSENLTENWNIK